MSTTTVPAPRLSRNLLFSLASAASAGLLLLLQSFASKSFSLDDNGLFQYALMVAVVGEALMDLGIHQVTVRAIARNRGDAARLLHNSLALKAVPGAVMFTVLGIYLWFGAGDGHAVYVCLLMLASAVLRSYLLTVRGIFLGLEHFGRDMAIVVIDRVLLLVVGVAVLWNGGGLIGLAWTFVAARLVTVGLALTLAQRLVGSLALGFDTALWRDLQREALPIGVSLVVFNFYSYIDTIMLHHMRTNEEVSLYTSAYRLYEGLCYAPAILSAVLTPRLSRLWSSSRQQHQRVARLGLVSAVGIAIALATPVAIFATPLLNLVFPGQGGTDNAAATLTLRILVAGLAFIFLVWILHAIAISTFHEQLLMRTTATGAVFNAVLNLFLIPAYGHDGAALATLAGEFLTMALLMYGLRQVLFRNKAVRAG